MMFIAVPGDEQEDLVMTEASFHLACGGTGGSPSRRGVLPAKGAVVQQCIHGVH